MKVPNVLTLSRIVLAPVFIFFFTRGTTWGGVGALAVAALFELTDTLDGQIARRTGQVSDLGKYMDPLADSIARFTVFLCFLIAGYASVWAVAIIFWRDSIVSTLRIMAATKDVIVSARLSGKIKAVVQGTAILSILAFAVWPRLTGHALLGIKAADVPGLARTIMAVVAAVTFASLFDYLYGNRRVLRALDR